MYSFELIQSSRLFWISLLYKSKHVSVDLLLAQALMNPSGAGMTIDWSCPSLFARYHAYHDTEMTLHLKWKCYHTAFEIQTY